MNSFQLFLRLIRTVYRSKELIAIAALALNGLDISADMLQSQKYTESDVIEMDTKIHSNTAQQTGSYKPSHPPSRQPTKLPSLSPSKTNSKAPYSKIPTIAPSRFPSRRPSQSPSGHPTYFPSHTAIRLIIPFEIAFNILKPSCVSVIENIFVLGFNSSSGYPLGNFNKSYVFFIFVNKYFITIPGTVYLTALCPPLKPVPYSVWVSTTWSFSGALVHYSVLPPSTVIGPSLWGPFTPTDQQTHVNISNTFHSVLYRVQNSLYRVGSVSCVMPEAVTSTNSGCSYLSELYY